MFGVNCTCEHLLRSSPGHGSQTEGDQYCTGAEMQSSEATYSNAPAFAHCTLHSTWLCSWTLVMANALQTSSVGSKSDKPNQTQPTVSLRSRQPASYTKRMSNLIFPSFTRSTHCLISFLVRKARMRCEARRKRVISSSAAP